MTFSIVAQDAETGHFGISVASRFFAAGAIVPYMAGGVGAIATQAFISPLYGTDGLTLLRSGAAARDVIEQIVMRDAGRHSRQVHLIDSNGHIAAFTGDKCIDWCGHTAADKVSVAGNMLAGPQVLEAMMSAYQDGMALPFEDRLIGAMEAGEAAGGDKRGRQSAALRIVRGEAYPWLDLRVDDHADPLTEIRRLLAVARERFVHIAELLPTGDNVHGALDRTEIDRRIVTLEAERDAAGLQSASFASAADDKS